MKGLSGILGSSGGLRRIKKGRKKRQKAVLGFEGTQMIFRNFVPSYFKSAVLRLKIGPIGVISTETYHSAGFRRRGTLWDNYLNFRGQVGATLLVVPLAL